MAEVTLQRFLSNTKLADLIIPAMYMHETKFISILKRTKRFWIFFVLGRVPVQCYSKMIPAKSPLFFDSMLAIIILLRNVNKTKYFKVI